MHRRSKAYLRALGVLWIAAFVMGASPAHADAARVPGGAWRSILPTGTQQPLVTIAPFQLDRVPVTNADYLAFVRVHPEWQRGHVPAVLADAAYLHHWRNSLELGNAADPLQPVTGVSWFAARTYCEAKRGRLPTWYEWELAAAADEHRRDARESSQWQQRILSWYSRPSNRALERVGLQPPNAYGIRDLHGLVWEWVEDFNALMMSGDSRNQNDPDILKFCGTGALALENREDYALAMRIALLSSMAASGTTINLGFRCAYGANNRSLPEDSLYHVDARLQTSDGRTVSFSTAGERLRIVTMFYANCPMACPLTIETLKNVDAALTAKQREKLEVLLLTLDPERDTPDRLHAIAQERRISGPRWTVARASLADTRKLAAVLGIQYRALDNAEFEHASTLILLDGRGRPLARTSKLGVPAPEFLDAVRRATARQ